MLLWNTGGNPGPVDMTLGMMLAKTIQAPCAFLYNIPNQPLFDGKKEDALIAETFVRFLQTKDENWPLLFPMVKSVVKAMDALEAFSQQEWKHPVKGFIISGASKRGWTTWLTGASDPRVRAICPLVIDTLNMMKQNDHQIEAFGGYSEQIRDYTQRGLVPAPKTSVAHKLWTMVDPYVYRDKLRLPKLIINGNNDPYWTADALNLYWDDLPGDKWVLYVPNAGHNLREKSADGRVGNPTRAVTGLAAFVRLQSAGKPMPKLTWRHRDANGSCILKVEATPAPKGARLWIAQAPTQDFREARWVEKPAKVDGQTVIGEVTPPKTGYQAFYAELDYAVDDLEYHLSTQIRVVGKGK
jgi:PhoPQ-activated pathogenicity-related protein